MRNIVETNEHRKEITPHTHNCFCNFNVYGFFKISTSTFWKNNLQNTLHFKITPELIGMMINREICTRVLSLNYSIDTKTIIKLKFLTLTNTTEIG